jgi:hypothetical protein
MIESAREIRPEDFQREVAHFVDGNGDCDPNERARYKRELERLAELKRLYFIQEEAKAKARFKAEQERKSQIPYSERLAIEICQRIGSGEFMINICKDEHLPTVRIITQWLKQHSDFRALHDEAVNDRLNIFEDEVITIPDQAGTDFEEVKIKGATRKILDPTKIAGAKLRVDVRRAHLKAYRPERWSDQSVLTVNNNVNDIDNLSLDELEKKISELEDKEQIIKAA